MVFTSNSSNNQECLADSSLRARMEHLASARCRDFGFFGTGQSATFAGRGHPNNWKILASAGRGDSEDAGANCRTSPKRNPVRRGIQEQEGRIAVAPLDGG